jgi:hypothetical protein
MEERRKVLSPTDRICVPRSETQESVFVLEIDPARIVPVRHGKYSHYRIGFTRFEKIDARVDVFRTAEGTGDLEKADSVKAVMPRFKPSHRMLHNGQGRCVVLRQLRWTNERHFEAVSPSDFGDLFVICTEDNP